MKIIKIIKSSIKSVKELRRPSLWTIIKTFSVFFIASLSKQYKVMGPLLRFYRIFKVWSIGSMVMSLVYSSIAELFNFTVDYRILIAILFGIGLIMKEFLLEFYFDIHNWISKLLDKIVSRLQNKVIETHNTGNVINQSTVDKVKTIKPRSDYLNISEVNKNNRIDQLLSSTNKGSLRPSYRDLTELSSQSTAYNMWSDWKFYAFALSILTSMYCLGVHYHYIPAPSFSGTWTYIKNSSQDVYVTIKNWFNGGGGPPAAGGNAAIARENLVDNIPSSSNTRLEDLPSGNTTPTPSTPRPAHTSTPSVRQIPGTSTVEIDCSNNPTSYIRPVMSNLISFYNEMSSRDLDFQTYPIQWVTLTNPVDIQVFSQMKRDVIGSLMFYLLEIQRLQINLPNYRSIISPVDLEILDNFMVASLFKVVELFRIYSITEFTNVNELIDAILIIAKIEHIDPIIDMSLKNRIDIILFDHVQDTACFLWFTTNWNSIKDWFNKLLKGNKKTIVMDHYLQPDHVMDYILENTDWLFKGHDLSIGRIYTHIPGDKYNLFEWINTNKFPVTLRFLDFESYKQYVFDNLLKYVSKISVLNEKGISLSSLSIEDRNEILQAKSHLTSELKNLYKYTNIENALDNYLLFAVFTHKAMDELVETG